MAQPFPTTAEYLRALGLVFQSCRGAKSVTEIAQATRGRVSRSTIQRLERGADRIAVRSQHELAMFYGLSLAAVYWRAWEALGLAPDPPTGGTITLTLTRADRDTVLRVLSRAETAPPTARPTGPARGSS